MRQPNRHVLLILLLLGGGAAACTEDPSADPTPDAAIPPVRDAAGPAQDSALLDGDIEEEDDGPPVPLACAEGGDWVGEIAGRIVDESGEGLPIGRAQVCVRSAPGDRLTCLAPAAPDAAGAYRVRLPAEVACVTHLAMRVFATETGWWTQYCPIETLPGGTAALTLDAPVVMGQVPALAEGMTDDLTSQTPVDVTFEGGLTVTVRPFSLQVDPAELNTLAGRRVSPGAVPLCFVPEEEAGELLALWAFTPEANADAENYPVRVANDLGLEAGVTVELMVLGGLGTTTGRFGTVAEGDWVPFGRARVSDDGAWLESDSGMPAFTWWGIRRDSRD